MLLSRSGSTLKELLSILNWAASPLPLHFVVVPHFLFTLSGSEDAEGARTWWASVLCQAATLATRASKIDRTIRVCPSASRLRAVEVPGVQCGDGVRESSGIELFPKDRWVGVSSGGSPRILGTLLYLELPFAPYLVSSFI